jgi:hypothetical protein
LIEAFQNLSLSWAAVPVIPFEPKLRKVEWEGPRVFYGSTGLVKLAMRQRTPQDPFFYDKKKFKPSVWGKVLGGRWLNDGAEFMNLGQLLSRWKNAVASLAPQFSSDDLSSFIRPDADLKAFPGQVFSSWDARDKLVALSNGWANFNHDLPVVVAEPKKIYDEIRVWVVGGEAVAAVKYVHDSKRVSQVIDLSSAMGIREFVEECAAMHYPLLRSSCSTWQRLQRG